MDELTPFSNYDELHAIQRRLTAARPLAASWIAAVMHHEALHIFEQAPATALVRAWLIDDLRQIAWVD